MSYVKKTTGGGQIDPPQAEIGLIRFKCYLQFSLMKFSLRLDSYILTELGSLSVVIPWGHYRGSGIILNFKTFDSGYR